MTESKLSPVAQVNVPVDKPAGGGFQTLPGCQQPHAGMLLSCQTTLTIGDTSLSTHKQKQRIHQPT